MRDAQQLYNTRFLLECQQFFQYFFVLFAEDEISLLGFLNQKAALPCFQGKAAYDQFSSGKLLAYI